MLSVKCIKLTVPNDYKAGNLLLSSNPQEIELILNYGEKLFQEHKNIALRGVSDEELSKLSNELGLRDKELSDLRKECQNLVQNFKQEKYALEKTQTEQIKLLKQTKEKELELLSEQHKEALVSLKKTYEELNQEKNNIYQNTISSLQNQILENSRSNERIYKELELKYNEEVKNHRISNLNFQSQLEQERSKIREELNKNYSDRVSFFEKQLEQDKSKMKETLEHERNRIKEELNKNYSERVSFFEKELNNKELNFQRNEEELKQSYENHKNEIMNIKNKQIQDLELKLAELKEQENSELMKAMKPVIECFSRTDNQTKGIIGEKTIEEYLKQLYNASEITHLGQKESHSGDILFKNNIYGINCLVEVKNKKNIIKEDVSKFIRDVSEQKNKGVNSGLFVSILTDNIPHKGDFHIEFHDGIPLIYVHCISKDVIKSATQVLIFLIQRVKNNHDSLEGNCRRDVIDLIADLNKTILMEKSRVNKIRLEMNKLVKLLETTENSFVVSLKNIINFYSKFDDLRSQRKEVKQNKGYTDSELDKIKEWIRENKKIPTRSDLQTILNLTSYQIRKKHITDIKDIMENYLSSIMELI